MRDLSICLFLALLFAAALWLVGQRDQQLDSLNARIDLLSEQVGHGNIPRITVAKGTIYAGSGSITIEKVENEKTD